MDNNKWFYPFENEECFTSLAVQGIHTTRKKILEYFLSKISCDTALDLGCHEGYFTLVLEKHIENVIGIDVQQDNLDKALYITRKLGLGKCQFVNQDINDYTEPADLVVCFGLLNHTENPIAIFRKLQQLTKNHLIIEAQVCHTSDIYLEDGTYNNVLSPRGGFALLPEFSEKDRSGTSNLVLVPDLNSLLFLLESFNFTNIEVYKPEATDYEQFVRNQRVVIYAEKSITI